MIKIQWQNVTPSGNKTQAASDSRSNTLLSTLTLGSLYSHALLIPLKSSKSKNQVVHEQMFKDLLSSTCQVSVERIVLDLESEVVRGRVLFPLGVTFCYWIFFHIVKPQMSILPLLPILSICEKLDCIKSDPHIDVAARFVHS